MKKIIYLCWVLGILAVGCKKQPVSVINSLAGTYSWSGIDTAIVIADTNIHFDTTVSSIADTSFSIQVLNDSQVVVAILSPIYKFDGEVLYNQLGLIETNTMQQTMTFYASPYTGYNFYCTSPPGHVAARTEYLTYNYGNHTLTYDCYLIDDVKEQWNLHLRSSGK
jgi:hypothetical protein